MNRIPLVGDVLERPIPYAGADRVAQALARDPALRSLPSDVLAQRLGTTRVHVDRAIAALVTHFTGAPIQTAGRSFDEAISDAGMARRAALSPQPLREAAGFRGAAGATAIERPPVYLRTRTGRRVLAPRGFDARGYEPPPIPDLSCLVLSDINPVTRRYWSWNDSPTQDEIQILNWQHPLIQGASSNQSISTIKAISQGCRSWDQDAHLVGGQSLSKRNDDERVKWWHELQTLMKYMGGGLPPPKVVPNDTRTTTDGQTVTGPTVTIHFIDQSDGQHPRIKRAVWILKVLAQLGTGDSILKALTNNDAEWQAEVKDSDDQGFGGNVETGPPGQDFEQGALLGMSGLIQAMSALMQAISAIVAVYCPACGAALSTATAIATKIAQSHLTVQALSEFGDALLLDAQKRKLGGDAGAYSGMQTFAASLIGLPPNVPNAVAAGGLITDYLNTLGTAPGNVVQALYSFATYRKTDVTSSADIARIAGVPLFDAQYAVASMTDTLTKFSANVSQTYNAPDPNAPLIKRAQMAHAAAHAAMVQLDPNVAKILQNGPMIPPGSGNSTPPVSGMTGGEKVALGAAVAGGLAWWLGFL